MNLSRILFFCIMTLGSLLSICSTSWFGVWAGLEINLLSFIPMMSENNLMSSEASLKYYLTQSFASVIFLFSVILYLMNWKNIEIVVLSSLLMKMGGAPFHFWFPSVMEGLTWINGFFLLTIQKLAPLVIISYFSLNEMVIMSVIFSSLVGSLGGLNQTSLRKLMAFSSINHLSWMLSSMVFNELVWFIYFLFYCFLSLVILLFFNELNVYYLSQLFSLIHYKPELKVFSMFNFLSLGGLPPFLGFFPKWMVIYCLTEEGYIFIVSILVIFALITLYFYLRLSYSSLMMNYSENLWKYQNFNSLFWSFFLLTSFMSIFGFVGFSLILFLI